METNGKSAADVIYRKIRNEEQKDIGKHKNDLKDYSLLNKKNMSNEKYIRPEDASKLLKVTCRTLLNWDYAGKVKSIRTKGGHRRYILSDILSISPDKEKEDEKRSICYCRVSTASQKEDLERQVKYFKFKYPTHEVIQDIGSGINFKRKGLNSILDSAIKGNIKEVVVTHKDRLCRFGFELVNKIIQEYSNGEIVVLDQQETSPEKELVNDLVSIITVFSSRLYGLRSHNIKRKIRASIENDKDKNISNPGGIPEITEGDGPIQVVL